MKPQPDIHDHNYLELLFITAQADAAGQFDQHRSDEMALPLETLIHAGMDQSQVKDWVNRGWFVHFQDHSNAGEHDRRLQRCERQKLGARSHLALTQLGFRVVRGRLDRAVPGIAIDGRVTTHDQRPTWDPASRTLHVDGEVVRKYRRHAPCQIAILAAFESARWPVELASPITEDIAMDGQDGLRDAVKALNKALVGSPLRFGTSQNRDYVHWGLAHAPSDRK